MKTVLITGSAGLIGGEAVDFFAQKGFRVVGIDNNMRQVFFGSGASTEWNRKRLSAKHPGYIHHAADIRDRAAVSKIFSKYSSDIVMVIHTAAQPSHDWAAKEPFTDFTVNAMGTLTMLEAARKSCPRAVFIFTSTNKVYGDTPNRLPLVEQKTRWEISRSHPFYRHGIDESMSIDDSTHSLFGVSKTAADLLVQEYGRYFGMKTAIFRGGCLTGPTHSGTKLHGFLSYLVYCAVTGTRYYIYGYKGKQVRDNIHSHDLVNAFYHFYRKPRVAQVYNMGGGRDNSCSVLEAIAMCETLSGKKMNWQYVETNRIGDHIWYISDVGKFKSHYRQWDYEYSLEKTLEQIYRAMSERNRPKGSR